MKPMKTWELTKVGYIFFKEFYLNKDHIFLLIIEEFSKSFKYVVQTFNEKSFKNKVM